MKKVLIGVVALAVVVAFVYATTNAKEEKEGVKIKATTVETPTGPETKIKGKAEDPESKTKITGEVKEGGEVREAEVTKTAKGTQKVLERKVKFHSYDQGTDTITVIHEKRLVRYQTHNLDSKRPYVLKWEKNKPIVITSTYDPKLGKDVVIGATAAPLQPEQAK